MNEEKVAQKEFDLAWEEYFKDKSYPENGEEEKKELEEFYHWYNYVRKQPDTGKTPAEMYKEVYEEEPPKEVIKESRMFNFEWDGSEEYEEEITKEAEEIVKETFPKLWNGVKEDMKDCSKKETAERMYLFGILTYMRMIDLGDKEMKEKMEKSPEIRNMVDEIKKNLEKE